MMRGKTMCLLAILLAASVFAEEENKAPGEIPARLPQIKLSDQTGKAWDVHESKDAKAVVIYVHGVGCPIVRLSAPALEEIKEKYAPKGVAFFMLNANAYDTAEDVKADAEDFSISVPILLNPEQDVAKALAIERTCTVIVAVPAQDWKIAYRGALSDRYDYLAQRPQAANDWLVDALDAVLAGKEVKTPESAVKGCLINYIEHK